MCVNTMHLYRENYIFVSNLVELTALSRLDCIHTFVFLVAVFYIVAAAAVTLMYMSVGVKVLSVYVICISNGFLKSHMEP